MHDRTAGLPAPAGFVCGRLLEPFGQTLLWPLLNRSLQRPIADGELDFLEGRGLAIAITDLAVEWRLTFRADTGRLAQARGEPHARIRADSAALLLLAGGRTDPDTLFFARRLVIEGDTELALQAKNLLDTLERTDLPRPLAGLVDRGAGVAERLSG